MDSNLPVILIDVVLVFGGVMAFGWWQLRSVARDRREAAARRKRAEGAARPDIADAAPKREEPG